MTTVASAALVAAAPITGTARAQALGLPATLFGFTPEQPEYWREPALPTLTARQMKFIDEMPLDYRGNAALLHIGYLDGNHMAPRFPDGCEVQTAPVWDKQRLVVGRVYTYCYQDSTTGELKHEMARLVKIGGNCLEVAVDNPGSDAADRTIWPLREEPGKEVWDVREVTHYVSYPEADELTTTTHLAAA